MIDKEQIIENLKLKPHPEGGFYRETYKSAETFLYESLPERYNSERAFYTAIYYMITADSFSAIHRLKSDEIFHYYLGSPSLILKLFPDGKGEISTIGPDILKGQNLQCIVPAGVWMGIRLLNGGEYCLLGTTVSPGFEFEDNEFGKGDELTKKYPEFAELIRELSV